MYKKLDKDEGIPGLLGEKCQQAYKGSLTSSSKIFLQICRWLSPMNLIEGL